jgi:sugar/nucleoside kinase (ribokinase family)
LRSIVSTREHHSLTEALAAGPAQVQPRPEHRNKSERASIKGSWVVGCGSAYVQHVQVVTSTPKAGEVVYLSNPAQPRSESSVGGAMVTLLSWASSLHVPTALLGLQGVDASGKMVTAALQKHGVSDAWVVASPEFITAENHVFAVDGDLGTASTLMAAGSSSLMNPQRMRKHFVPSLRTAGVCIAEIGAVPCAAVETLLQEARAKKLMTLLAVDVLPTTVIGESQLGTLEELQSCITQADVLMQPRSVAEQLLYMTADEVMAYEDTLLLPTTELASLLRSSTGADLVAIVDGDVATKGCVLATLGASVHIPPMGACARAAEEAAAAAAAAAADEAGGFAVTGAAPTVDVPTTPLLHDAGVTHAFYGGLLSALYHAGGVPTEVSAITQAGSMANATASACLRNLLSLPDLSNTAVMEELKKDVTIDAILKAVEAEQNQLQGAQQGLAGQSMLGGVGSVVGEMAAYRSSYETDAACAERLAQVSGAHGRGGDATRAHAIVNCLLGCEAMGGSVLVAAEQEEQGVARRLALSLAACGFRTQFVAAEEAGSWPHGWAYSVRSNDTVICISHDGRSGSGSLAEAVGVVRSVQQASDSSSNLPGGGGVASDSVGEENAAGEQEDDVSKASGPLPLLLNDSV